MARHHANYTARISVIGLTVLRIPDYIKFYILFAWYKKFSIVKNSVITPVPRRGRPVIEAKQKVNPLREALYANDLDCTKVHKARTKLFGMKLWFVRNYIKRDLNQSFRNLFWIYYSDLKKKYHPSKKKTNHRWGHVRRHHTLGVMQPWRMWRLFWSQRSGLSVFVLNSRKDLTFRPMLIPNKFKKQHGHSKGVAVFNSRMLTMVDN